MTQKKMLSLLMIHILIVGFIGFANADEEAFDPAACVKDNTCDMSTLTTEQQNELLAYIKNNVNDRYKLGRRQL